MHGSVLIFVGIAGVYPQFPQKVKYYLMHPQDIFKGKGKDDRSWAELYHLLYIDTAGKLTLAVIFQIRPYNVYREVRSFADVDIKLTK